MTEKQLSKNNNAKASTSTENQAMSSTPTITTRFSRYRQRLSIGLVVAIQTLAISTGLVGFLPQRAFAQGTPTTNEACAAMVDENGLAKYAINVPSDGTYTVWMRVKAANTASQLKVSVDSTNKTLSCEQKVSDATKVNDTNWEWIKTKLGGDTFSVPLVTGTANVQIGGVATFDHVKLDRVMLLTDGGCVPKDKGDNCLSSSEPNPTPIPQPVQGSSLFSASLTGQSGSTASGIGTLIMNPAQTSATVYTELTNLNVNDVTATHIRNAAGDVLFTLTNVQGILTLTPALAADLMAGNWTIDVDTAARPTGEVKGTFKFVATTPGATPNPTPNPNPTGAPAVGSQLFATGLDPVAGLTTTGTASMVISPDHTKGTVTLSMNGIANDQVLSYHVHGPAGGSQDAVLYVFNDNPHTITVNPEQFADIMAGKWYIEVHTNAHQDGELNGYMHFVVTIPEAN